MASSSPSKFLLLAVLVASTTSLVVRKGQTDCGGADPADSTTIDGDDCGNVKQIIGKWAKSKKVGSLNGAATAAINAATETAQNTDDAISRATTLGEQVGLGGHVPSAVASAAAVAVKASTAVTAAATALKTTSQTFKGKFGNFAKAVTDDDIIKIKKETREATEAKEDAEAAATRVTAKAAEAKEKAMKSSAGAKQMIEGLVKTMKTLSDKAGQATQTIEKQAKDTAAMAVTAGEYKTTLDTEAAASKEQAPVWQAYKDDLVRRESGAKEQSAAAVALNTKLTQAVAAMNVIAKDFQATLVSASSDQNAWLGQAEKISTAEQAIRGSDQAFANLQKPMQSLVKDNSAFDKKLKATHEKTITAGKAAKPAAAETASDCKCADPLFDIKNPSDWLGKYWPGKPPSPMQNLSQALLFMDQCTADDFIAGQAAMSKAPGDAFANNRVMARFGNYVRECGGKTGRSQWCGWPGATKDLYNPGNHFGGWQEITEWWSAANGGGWQPTVVVGGRTRTAWSKAQKTSAYDNLKAALKKAYKAHKGEDYPEECQKAAR